MSGRRWTQDEIEFVQNHPAWTAEKIAKKLNRTPGAVLQVAYRGKIKIKKRYNIWTEEEILAFKEDWYNENISDKCLSRLHKGRSIIALRNKAMQLGLGHRMQGKSSLTIRDIMSEMNVSKDRVRAWLKKGLKHKIINNKQKRYFINQKDLLEFLHNHPDLYDASKISDVLFTSEPQWLKNKRKKDRDTYVRKMGVVYTENELKTIISLFKSGQSNEQIAKAVKRTPAGVAKILDEFGLSRHKYNDYEIEILHKYAPEKTIDEIVKMLPLRKRSGIIAKCQHLKIPYKTRKD